MKVYKIRHKITGLYSTGTSRVKWTETGKTWSKQGHVTSHMSNGVGYRHAKDIYKDAEIVEFELTEIETRTIPINDFIEIKLEEARTAMDRARSNAERRRYEEAKRMVQQYEGGSNG